MPLTSKKKKLHTTARPHCQDVTGPQSGNDGTCYTSLAAHHGGFFRPEGQTGDTERFELTVHAVASVEQDGSAGTGVGVRSSVDSSVDMNVTAACQIHQSEVIVHADVCRRGVVDRG